MPVTVPYQPQNLVTEQADGNILLTWQGALGATSYQIQRSTDGVNFSNLATAGLVTQYEDALPGVGIKYWYQVAGVNGSGTGSYSSVSSMIAAPPSEMSLYELRLRSQQTADRVNSDFVVTSEWNAFIRLALYELYDLLITSYEDYFASQQAFLLTNGSTQYYDLPNGYNNYLGGNFTGIAGTPAQAFYKMAGVDLAVNTSTVNPAWVTLQRFNFIDRNKYIYPNSTSSIYGVYNQAYRIMGNQIDFIPVPAGSQTLRLWYTPKLPALLKDTDFTTLGYSGWIRYPIVRAARYALTKEEGTDVSKLDEELAFLKLRIEQAAQNRDAGIPDRISETRRDGIYGGTGWGNGMGGGNAGWMAALLFPGLISNYIGNPLLANTICLCQHALALLVCGIIFANFAHLYPSKLGKIMVFARKSLSKVFNRRTVSVFGNHILNVIQLGPEK